MKFCAKCNEIIINKDLNKNFQITLGNIENGCFYGKKTLYYHKKCISDSNDLEKVAILECS